jgi:hypothetical protein
VKDVRLALLMEDLHCGNSSGDALTPPAGKEYNSTFPVYDIEEKKLLWVSTRE